MSMNLPRGILNYTLVFQIPPEKVFGWYVFWNPNTSSLSVFGNLRLGEAEFANDIEKLLASNLGETMYAFFPPICGIIL